MNEAGLLERSEDWTRLAPGGVVRAGFYAGIADAEADLAAERDLCRDPFRRTDRQPALLRWALERDDCGSGNGPRDGEETFIGSGRGEADGTIGLDLVSNADGTIAEGQVRYAPTAPNDASVAARVGPIPTGGKVLARPFPGAGADPRR